MIHYIEDPKYNFKGIDTRSKMGPKNLRDLADLMEKNEIKFIQFGSYRHTVTRPENAKETKRREEAAARLKAQEYKKREKSIELLKKRAIKLGLKVVEE